jgi:hypothetical protein
MESIAYRELAKLLEMSNYEGCLDKMTDEQLLDAIKKRIEELLLREYQYRRELSYI